MLSLGLDSSSKASSVALFDGDRLIWEGYLDCGNTHSTTLMPLVEQGLNFCDKRVSDIDAIYYSAGPGSFTGLRIGGAAVKGLAFGRDIKVKGISTLLGLAYNLQMIDGYIFSVLDARASQVYGALFKAENGVIERVTDDAATAISELSAIIPAGSYVVGDGAALLMEHLGESLLLKIPPSHLRLQRAASVVLAGMVDKEGYTKAEDSNISYIRRPQAERERLANLANQAKQDKEI